MAKNSVTIFVVVVASLGLMFAAGCQSEAQTGAGLGAAAGAGIGAIIGHQTGRAAEGALIGGAIGGAVGYGLGNEQDKTEALVERHCLREEMNTVRVRVTNSNGSIIQVPLKKQGVGYVGTRGEYYPTMPSEDQLRMVYGF